MNELPVLQDAPPERADAARNRGKVLAAAERLVAECGASCVSMDAVAREAGVGKGTLFRRFGDRAGLMQAVLSERERLFQEDIIRGPAPLGPGAPPVERLIAFGQRLLAHHADYGELLAAAEAAGARYRSPPFGFYRTHVSCSCARLRLTRTGSTSPTSCSPPWARSTSRTCERVREMDQARVAAGWAELARRLLG